MAKIGEVIDGKYEVLSLIGEGGMSRVWLVRDRRLSKLWAVKEIGRTAKDANNTVVVQSLIAEANLMKRLDHPALPRIVDIIEDGKTIFVVMDYVEGESLNKVMRRTGHPMPEEDVISWGIQLCDALNYLHTRTPPVIYRDMKPGNIMLREDGTVKLIDFGIAREYDESKSSDTQILGTRGYAAPEQLNRNVQTDARTDIYSLGVTLYNLVTGRSPSDDAVLRPIRSINPALSEGLEHIILKATQQDPNARYQSCDEMRYDLEHHENLTWEYRSAQEAKIKRFNVLRIAAAALAAAGIVCLLLSSYFKNSTYETHIVEAQASSIDSVDGSASPAEESYTAAIEIDPSQMLPYKALVNDVYKGDWNFTMQEASRWTSLYSAYSDNIENSPEYAKLCYDVGVLFYVYYEQGDGDDASRTYAMSAGVQAAQWFQRAIDDYDLRTENGNECTMTASERSAASTYVTIGQFYQKLSQGTLEGSEGSIYEGYWESLEEAFEALSDDDSVMVKLRLYQLIHEAVESPTYLNGFRRVGVEQSRVEELLSKVAAATRAVADDVQASEKSQSMYDEIVEGYDSAVANIEATYGNAALMAMSAADFEDLGEARASADELEGEMSQSDAVTPNDASEQEQGR